MNKSSSTQPLNNDTLELTLLIMRNISNVFHGRVMSVAVIAFELIFTIIAILSKVSGVKESFNYNFYISMYIFLILLNIVYTISLRNFNKNNLTFAYQKLYGKIILIYSYIFIFWGMTISFADQSLYSNLNALFINLIAISAFYYMTPRESLPLFITSAVIFFIVLPIFQKDSDLLVGHYVNSVVIFTFVGLISILSNKIHSQNTINEDALRKQINVNESINEALQDAVGQLEILIREDSLTGLPNRRGLDQFILKLFQAHLPTDTPLNIMMIDIDHFKEYNDTYGHLLGDEALKRISHQLTEHVTSLNDYVIRFGGEEFLFINIGKPISEALELANNLKASVKAIGIKHEHSTCDSVATISIGLFTTQIKNQEWINEAITLADQALYKAKNNGRNQVWHKIDDNA